MYKAIVLLKRSEGTSTEEFREWFFPHARRAIRIGGDRIQRYTASFVVGQGPRSPWVADEPPFDVVSELWCKDRETLEETYRDLSAAGSEVERVLAAVSVRVSLITDEVDLLALDTLD